MTIAAVEPFYGGSHKRFLDEWAACSALRIELFTQPARRWKWRMRGSALHFAEQAEALGRCDVLVASDFLNVAEFLGLADGRWPGRRPPLALFMHENQLTYPVQPGSEAERDFHYAFTNLTSCLAADAVWFNSAFHRDEFLEAIGPFLKRFPDAAPKGVAEAIRAKSTVLHLGVALPDPLPAPAARETGAPLRIGWNHRWEFDKHPEGFFEALDALQADGAVFEVVVLGEQYRHSPAVFEEARARLGARVGHWGFAESREDYLRLLAGCDVVISTAIHEFFGQSAVEAGRVGCALLLPERLAYPELLDEASPELRAATLYKDAAELLARLRACVADPARARAVARQMPAVMARFDWSVRGPALDEAARSLVSSSA